MIDLQTYRGLHEKMDQCFAGQILDSSEEPFHPFTTPNECGINGEYIYLGVRRGSLSNESNCYTFNSKTTDAAVAASGGNFVYDVSTFDAYPDVLDAGACHLLVL